MKTLDMGKYQKKYPGKWIALKGEKAIAVSIDLKEVIDKAQKKGIKTPTLTKIPSKSSGYVL